MTCLEVVTIEVCARMILDFAGAMPDDFLVDIATQCEDEARHAAMCCDRIRELGYDIGDFDIDLQPWHASYGLDLAERLAAHQRIGEQLGSDGAILNSDLAAEFGDERTGRMFEYVTIDEISYVNFGNKWIRRLVSAEQLALVVERAIRRRDNRERTKFTAVQPVGGRALRVHKRRDTGAQLGTASPAVQKTARQVLRRS